MDTGEKYAVKTIRRRTKISPIEGWESARSRQRYPNKRQKREDLLTFYLRMQDEKKKRSSLNQQNDIFTLPCPDSLRRDIEVLQRFIKKFEPPGDVVREEVVIATEVTEKITSKPNEGFSQQADVPQDPALELPTRDIEPRNSRKLPEA